MVASRDDDVLLCVEQRQPLPDHNGHTQVTTTIIAIIMFLKVFILYELDCKLVMYICSCVAAGVAEI
jgi:hypothetical protein